MDYFKFSDYQIFKLNKMSVTATFKHVSYLWDESKAAALAGDEVALLIYRSNLLGADLRLTNYGGGNTSCKTIEKDPLTGADTEVMWVKGSGGDIGTLRRVDLQLYMLTGFVHFKMFTAVLSMKMRWWSYSIIAYMILIQKLLPLTLLCMDFFRSNT